MARKLPKWLTRREDGTFSIDPDIAYPIVLDALEVDESQIDQYWIETAYQCAKMAAQEIVAGTELDPRPKMGLVFNINSSGERKKTWALANYKAGKGILAATKGLEAKQNYPRVRAALAE